MTYEHHCREQTDFGGLVTYWFGTSVMLFCDNGRLLSQETLNDEWYVA